MALKMATREKSMLVASDVPSPRKVQTNKFRRFFFNLVEHWLFSLLIMAGIIANIICLALDQFEMDPDLN